MVVIGKDCGYLSFLKNLAGQLKVNEKVYFVGEVSESLLYSAYAGASVFLLTSLYEGLPTVVLEAMACKVPVVASRTGGTIYSIEQGKVGFLTEFGDVQSTASLITSLLTNQELKCVLGANGRTFVEKHYSWAQNAMKVEQVYSAAASKKTVKDPGDVGQGA
jgi:glycosyltransferase involved in cell wall biosynthesis